jgi:uncharacterized protein (DUF362 family)
MNFDVDPDNAVYPIVRQCLSNLGLDAENIDKQQWNPFGDLVRLGDTVVIKPNLVLHFNKDSDDIEAVVTHGSVVRPILDYVIKALKGSGRIVVGDAPHGNADFDKIVQANGIKSLVEYYRRRGITIDLIDFRKYIYAYGPQGFLRSVPHEVRKDPQGYVVVELNKDSFLCDLEHLDRLYGSDYDRTFIVKNHLQTHKYCISGSVINADVVISMPKAKTHKKTGVTLNLKNLVGINGDKNYLPHYRIGPPLKGGDEYPDHGSAFLDIIFWWNRWSRDHLLSRNSLLLRRMFGVLNKPFAYLRSLYVRTTGNRLIELGDWPGNDTTWRMCLDLYYILLYADKTGAIKDGVQRRIFSVVDGIIAGEGDGPLQPDAKNCGFIVGGKVPLDVDYVTTNLMGFDPGRIKVLDGARRSPLFAFSSREMEVVCQKGDRIVNYTDLNFAFRPHYAWKGQIEKRK